MYHRLNDVSSLPRVSHSVCEHMERALSGCADENSSLIAAPSHSSQLEPAERPCATMHDDVSRGRQRSSGVYVTDHPTNNNALTALATSEHTPPIPRSHVQAILHLHSMGNKNDKRKACRDTDTVRCASRGCHSSPSSSRTRDVNSLVEEGDSACGTKDANPLECNVPRSARRAVNPQRSCMLHERANAAPAFDLNAAFDAMLERVQNSNTTSRYT